MNPKARITYRFDHKTAESGAKRTNGPEGGGETKGGEAKVVPIGRDREEMTFTTEIASWKSPFQDDIGALEQLIRDTDADYASAERKGANSGSVKTGQAKNGTIKVGAVKNVEDARRSSKGAPPSVTASGPATAGGGRPDALRPDGARTAAADDADGGSYWFSADASLLLPADGEDLPDWMPKVPHREGPVIERDAEAASSSRFGSFGRYSTVRSRGPARGPSWMKVFLSVTGAIATGALFGYVLLSLFADQPSLPSGRPGAEQTSQEGATASPGDETSVPASGEDGEKAPESGAGEERNAAANPAGTVAVKAPERTYQMLQFGVFSSSEGRDAAIAQLKDKGLAAAALSTDADFRVYAGIADNRSEALALSARMPDLEVFIKQVDVPAATSLPFAGKSEELQSFIDLTGELVGQLGKLTVAQLEQPSLSPIGEAAVESWKETHEQWTKAAAAAQAGAGDGAGKTAIAEIVKSLNSAAVALEEYNRKPAVSHLWSVQSALMNAVLAEKGWRESASAL